MAQTIFAVSSGAPPAAIAIIRISGPRARAAAEALAGSLPPPRKAGVRQLKSSEGRVLDEALVLWFPGPNSASGEDLAELHCHGGRAVLSAIETALGQQEGLRRAEPGEFTRRAFANGRMDLAQAEALGDLLAAETELQRQAAQAGFGGVISARVENWRSAILNLSAGLEAALDFSDEEDTQGLPAAFYEELREITLDMGEWLARPPAERLRDGVRVVLAGPPNSGKSSLFNALLGISAAITSAEAGTTRDVIERPVALGGVPLVLIDTAGLRRSSDDQIELIGIERAEAELAKADLVLWLGPEGAAPQGGDAQMAQSIEVAARCDAPDAEAKTAPHVRVSASTGEGMDDLKAAIISRAQQILPKPGEAALNARQRQMVSEAKEALSQITPSMDLLLAAENLRIARVRFDGFLGQSSTEDMLDALFARFCIGK